MWRFFDSFRLHEYWFRAREEGSVYSLRCVLKNYEQVECVCVYEREKGSSSSWRLFWNKLVCLGNASTTKIDYSVSRFGSDWIVEGTNHPSSWERAAKKRSPTNHQAINDSSVTLFLFVAYEMVRVMVIAAAIRLYEREMSTSWPI